MGVGGREDKRAIVLEICACKRRRFCGREVDRNFNSMLGF